MNPEKRTMLPPALFHSFAKRFEEPSVKEGFQDIVKVDFVVSENLNADADINIFLHANDQTVPRYRSTEGDLDEVLAVKRSPCLIMLANQLLSLAKLNSGETWVSVRNK
jgi:hypothetical protein